MKYIYSITVNPQGEIINEYCELNFMNNFHYYINGNITIFWDGESSLHTLLAELIDDGYLPIYIPKCTPEQIDTIEQHFRKCIEFIKDNNIKHLDYFADYPQFRAFAAKHTKTSIEILNKLFYEDIDDDVRQYACDKLSQYVDF